MYFYTSLLVINSICSCFLIIEKTGKWGSWGKKTDSFCLKLYVTNTDDLESTLNDIHISNILAFFSEIPSGTLSVCHKLVYILYI